MKKSLFLLLLPIFSFGQMDTLKMKSGCPMMEDSVYVFEIYDTVPALMLCSDTAEHKGLAWLSIEGHRVNWTFSISGFEVRENKPSYDNWECGLNNCIGWRDHKSHFDYLDENKKHLKYLVWQAQ